MAALEWNAQEDGRAGRDPFRTLHHEGTAEEFVRLEMPIRLPWWAKRKVRLVMRAYQATGDVTLALERIRVER